MKVFVIHRFEDTRLAKKTLETIARDFSLEVQPILLDSSGDMHWRRKAEDAIRQSEVVVIFNSKSCQESSNVEWEIERAKEAGKKIIEIDSNCGNTNSISALRTVYEMNDEFENCFSSCSKEDALELYKLMIDSSESLMQRRQRVNVFFITAIAGLFTIAGILENMSENITVLVGVLIICLLLCYSWENLIENYGKLNKAKFDVILKLEEAFQAKIFTAEWIALGKGLRHKKYKSFTSTERNVPQYFRILIIALLFMIIVYPYLS